VRSLIFICLFVPIFILLSLENDGGTIFWMNPNPLRSCQFPSFAVVSLSRYVDQETAKGPFQFFDFLLLNLLLVRSHQAEIIIVKRLIQGRNSVCDEDGS